MPHLLLQSKSMVIIYFKINRMMRLRKFSTVQCQEDGKGGKETSIKANRLRR